jgi:hypothetical protein
MSLVTDDGLVAPREKVTTVRRRILRERLDRIFPSFSIGLEDPMVNCPEALYYWPKLFTGLRERGISIVLQLLLNIQHWEIARDLKKWIRHSFRLEKSIDARPAPTRARNIGEQPECHLWQGLRELCRVKDNFVFGSDDLVKMRRLAAPVCPGWVATNDKQSLALVIAVIGAVARIKAADSSW